MRPGFLKRFAACCLSGGFAVLHEAGGQCPEAELWLDGASAEKNLLFVFDDAADYQPRVFIMDMAASSANMAREAVTGRDGIGNARAAEDAVTDHENG